MAEWLFTIAAILVGSVACAWLLGRGAKGLGSDRKDGRR